MHSALWVLEPLRGVLRVKFDWDLRVGRHAQELNQLCSRLVGAIDSVLVSERPDIVLVQGDTTTALAGALAARYRKVRVGHVEAGLRTGNADSPFPEEINRQVITRLTNFHFAATHHNMDTLLAEGVDPRSIALTGNPVVDALAFILAETASSPEVDRLISTLKGRRLIVLTTHRRESSGAMMRRNLQELRRFVEQNEDIVLVFPVHPNPAVREAAHEVLGSAKRAWLIEPLNYADFLHLMAAAWLVVSDSGGIQEEAPSLGKPLLVLRENTERPEAVSCGAARLVGESPERLAEALDDVLHDDGWAKRVERIENPFGRGDAGERIVDALSSFLRDVGTREGVRDRQLEIAQ